MTDTAFYAEMQATAQELLEDFGAPVQLIKKGNPSAGFDENGDPITATPDIIVNGVGAALNYNINEIDGTVIQAGDCKLLYRGDEPEINMAVMLSGIKWRVVAVMPLSPAGIVVMYGLQLRK